MLNWSTNGETRLIIFLCSMLRKIRRVDGNSNEKHSMNLSLSLSCRCLLAIDLVSQMLIFASMFGLTDMHAFMCALRLLSDKEVINWNSWVYTLYWYGCLIFIIFQMKFHIGILNQSGWWLFFLITALKSYQGERNYQVLLKTLSSTLLVQRFLELIALFIPIQLSLL